MIDIGLLPDCSALDKSFFASCSRLWRKYNMASMAAERPAQHALTGLVNESAHRSCQGKSQPSLELTHAGSYSSWTLTEAHFAESPGVYIAPCCKVSWSWYLFHRTYSLQAGYRKRYAPKPCFCKVPQIPPVVGLNLCQVFLINLWYLLNLFGLAA